MIKQIIFRALFRVLVIPVIEDILVNKCVILQRQSYDEDALRYVCVSLERGGKRKARTFFAEK